MPKPTHINVKIEIDETLTDADACADALDQIADAMVKLHEAADKVMRACGNKSARILARPHGELPRQRRRRRLRWNLRHGSGLARERRRRVTDPHRSPAPHAAKAERRGFRHVSNRRKIQALLPHCTIDYGYTLDGAGPARFGWSATTKTGCVRYLGRGQNAIETAEQIGSTWGAR